MVFGTLILLSASTFFLLTRDIKFNIKKKEKIEFCLTVLRHTFNFRKKEKNTSADTTNRKSISPYLKTLFKNKKRLRKARITISEIALPYKVNDFSVDSFLLPYKEFALISGIVSFLEAQFEGVEIKEGAVSVATAKNSFCLDITIKIKLFYALLFLSDSFVLSIKERKKNRRKAYVREQNG